VSVAIAATIDYEAMISARARAIDVSGIRRVFELGAKLANPIDFSIGQPHFAVPDPVKEATIAAIREDRNGYTLTQGDPVLREAIARHLAADVGWTCPSDDLALMVSSGTSGALLLAFLATLNPGDEVIIPDPFFVIYPALGGVAGAKVVFCDTYPDFRMTAERVEPLITPRTKLLLVNSPGNPSGVVLSGRELRDLVDLCEARGVMIVTDEIYDKFTYSDALEDGRCPSPARFTRQMILVRGFGKTYGCTGWRMGYAAGPPPVIQQMAKLQQYTFVCAPSMAQRGLARALGLDVSANVAAYEAKRDLVERVLGPVADMAHPGGAFYAFIKVPTEVAAGATEFVERAIERNVLLIPGCVFSSRDTHLRLSYAVPDESLETGLRILAEMLAR
jgi:aspartate/methionine/tyrosine aminotransferase